ncbi:flavodoxin-dependent (E)-4-hydroxy-3-methylbut-2-enyl-diphosphate synthase [Bilophila wadsworthia]|uniref:flavodoxin-dependent (E)-4-hydroxy-3-methylbut-2-enyl-diphosphate synthase n=1 Tax=Bilophila wadsworthia TaxID=35833 RepID=UPI002A7F29B0|nr:flavodoxin-dependent (E)-4-hydroxy-3-methylbut-2-enyl-diphosphate synthase [Bilophila wadsworthia]MDY3682013.1 flavodoxin-dependent (E)-4-hydroxy-3-methylbut-2-enyl-diphosphate synthase [Bilophila wadsworthia]
MELPRKQTRQLKLGSVRIGGGAPIVVQSMTNTDTRDVEATLGQIKRLHDAGCEIVRVAIPDETAARALRAIHDASPIPVIADIHFDYRLALMALEAGLEGLRINPGNIGERKNVEMVVDAAKARGAVLRVGVNSGSVEKRLLEQYGGPTPQAMVESALGHVRILEEHGFYDTKISIKSSSVLNTIECYRLLSQRCDYPLHLGVTEAGGVLRGAIKSSVGMGVLLSEGIGDTLRVSLTAAPEEEMTVAWELLRALGLRQRGPEIISCPTCGRTEIDLIGLAQEVERRLRTENAPIKVAVMGCVVNGPGEAREADLGMAGGRDKGIIFRKGEVIRSVRGQEALLAAFMEELDKLLVERRDL